MPLTSSGNADQPAISPDGKYVAYIQRSQDGTSLRLRQTSTSSDQQVVALRPGITLMHPTFTADGDHIDFLRLEGDARTLISLWRVPLLGGRERRLVDKIWSAVGWSQTGQMAFVRYELADKSVTTSLIVAAADGGNERTLASRTTPQSLQ